MTNSNYGQGFGPQAMFQPGFAGSDAGHVKQQNQQSFQSGPNGGGQQSFGGSQAGSQFSGGQFTSGPQAMFQPGFAGSDAEHVRQQNQQSFQSGPNGGGQQSFGGSQAIGSQFSGGQFTSGSQAMFQPGFAGSDAQHVRQQNQQSFQSGPNGGNQQQSFGGSQAIGSQAGSQFSSGQFTSGPQAMFQPGFAGSDAGHVRQQNQQSFQSGPNGGGQQQSFGGVQSGQGFNFGQQS